MPGPSITIEPVSFKGKTGQTVTITVIDHGHEPITVTGIPTVLHRAIHGCSIHAAPEILTFSPARFTLIPGESRRVRVTIHKSPAPHIGALFVATHHGAGNVQSGAGVAAQITLHGEPLICSPQTHTSTGAFPFIPVIALTTIVIILALALAILRDRLRNSH